MNQTWLESWVPHVGTHLDSGMSIKQGCNVPEVVDTFGVFVCTVPTHLLGDDDEAVQQLREHALNELTYEY